MKNPGSIVKVLSVAGVVALSWLTSATADLVSYWSFEAGAGDAMGAHDGTLVGGASISRKGDGFGGGRSLRLTADGDYLDLANPKTFDFNSDFTWHARIKTADGSGAIFSRNPNGTAWNQGSKALFVRNNNVDWDTGWVSNPHTNVAVTDNVWHTVIATYNSTSDLLNIFVDPKAGATTGNFSGTHDVNRFDEHTFVHNGGVADTSFTLGKADFSGGLASLDTLLGLLDDAAVFDNELTGADLDNLIVNGPSWFLPLVPGKPTLQVRGEGGNLLFTWDSKTGKLYDLLSASNLTTAPETWAVWDGRQNIEATPDENSLTIPRPAEPTRFFAILERDPPPLFAENFDTVIAPALPPGWVADGTSGTPPTAWQLGAPAALTSPAKAPSAAFSGTNCVGTNLNALYGPDAAVTLTTPPIHVPAGGATLSFRQVVDIDGPTAPLGGGADFATLRVLDAADDSELAVIEALLEGSTGGSWVLYSRTLPAAAIGKSVRFEFKLESDGGGVPDGFELAGWYLDDVAVTATTGK